MPSELRADAYRASGGLGSNGATPARTPGRFHLSHVSRRACRSPRSSSRLRSLSYARIATAIGSHCLLSGMRATRARSRTGCGLAPSNFTGMRMGLWSHLRKYRVVTSSVERIDLSSLQPGAHIAETMVLAQAIDDNGKVIASGLGSSAYDAVNDLAKHLPRPQNPVGSSAN